MARKNYIPLQVLLNGRAVGHVERERSGAISFRYDKAWLNWAPKIPISLSLPLREARYVGEPVFAVFENLLPDNEHILKRVAERVGAKGIDAYSMLSAIGRDCVGALQFIPANEKIRYQKKLEATPIDAPKIYELIKNLDVSPLGIRPENDFRISIAGAQDKTALLWHHEQWHIPSGTTPTTHIFKPQIGKIPNGMDLSQSVENEYFCMKLMQNFGLDVADVDIWKYKDVSALIVKRFDRRWTKEGRLLRLPQEDCCQALSFQPTQKYENVGGPGIPKIMELLRGSDDPNNDQKTFFKASILFWMIGATDGHAKNFSVKILPQGRFRLAPLYDILTMEPEYASKRLRRKDYKLAMKWGDSGHYKLTNILPRHFLQTGLKSGLSKEIVIEILEEIESEAPEALAKTICELPYAFPKILINSISKAMAERTKKLSTRDSF